MSTIIYAFWLFARRFALQEGPQSGLCNVLCIARRPAFLQVAKFAKLIFEQIYNSNCRLNRRVDFCKVGMYHFRTFLAKSGGFSLVNQVFQTVQISRTRAFLQCEFCAICRMPTFLQCKTFSQKARMRK